ncbi:hypothetical protein PHYSODRAFT_319267 [Phytophthora sojae]|uniref:DDE Tnp4 domain-containing protein n=1 Tax=Phytophthora sojae (strain P6497) TaxID=1094619 RepID=G5A9V7_PHYSP|nr:hypothetical protein PHYSODRAFT_319267 [Phytophthora sojae]EGZ07387.1 hypothetical protein PHYSODRAFT_319267 [Phytophthora sojae]|eukprot:XP_009536953.1 hypothetical protein PHYSODRAFT_319267 [Phytophthora sojae]
MQLSQADALELLVLLAALNEAESWLRPLIPDVRLDLGAYGYANAVKDFRFDVHGIRLLVRLCAMPDTVFTEAGDRCVAEEARAVMLYRLSYPRRLHDMRDKFGRSTPALSRIFLWTVEYVDNRYSELMYFNLKLVTAKMNDYCAAIQRRSPAQGIFAFPDGTKVPICRPSPRQRRKSETYNTKVDSGRRSMYTFFGPYEGRRLDTTVFAASALLNFFGRHSVFECKAIFGDPAYSISKYAVTRFKSVVQTTHERIFNKEMSSVRAALRLSPIGKFVRVAMLMTNCLCCYQGGNQISSYFELQQLQEYLQ